MKLDDRPIKAIFGCYGDEKWQWLVGHEECTHIIVGYVNGQMEGVPWFEVYRDGVLICRENAAFIQTVLYEIPEES